MVPLTYELPDARIAQTPLDVRSDAKLLVYRDGVISDHIYHELPYILPNNAVLVRNISRVIPARIPLSNGGEIFLIEPRDMSFAQAMTEHQSVVWRCLVGGAKKTIGEYRLGDDESVRVSVYREPTDGSYSVRFTWSVGDFSDVLHRIGHVPLPPYLERGDTDMDHDRYQTVFARESGSVAAPTASLHMTDDLLQTLQSNGVTIADVILHVGMGTFMPIWEDVESHVMHSEQFTVPAETLRILADALLQGRPIVAMGTTAFRVVESLAWADKWFDPQKSVQHVPQDVWHLATSPRPSPDQERDVARSGLQYLLAYAAGKSIQGTTQIFCTRDYVPQIVTGLLTNFHQPGSTLLELVASFTGSDLPAQAGWERVYNHALENEYRFLSYGDTSLLWR